MKFTLGTLFLLMFAAVAPAQEVKFTSGDAAREIPCEMAQNLVIVKASVGKAAPGWFIFDTGAESTVVDSKYAAAAGLAASGKTTGTGSAGTAVAGVIKDADLKLAGLEATHLTMYSLPLDVFSPGIGRPIAGIIGNDIIGKVVAEIDYTNSRLSLISPAGFQPTAGAEMVPMIIEEDLPFIHAGLVVGGKTLDAKMEIDTGSTGAVLFNSPYVRRYRLTARIGRTLASRSGGVGGSGTSRIGRAESITFGKTVFSEPLAVLYTGTRGDNASRKYDGLLGGAIFRRFKMTVDIPGRRLFLEPTSRVNEPFETDMSGMDLIADGHDLSNILVDEVKPASAAARAGIRGGEFIRSINGHPVTRLGIDEVKRLFRTAGEYDVVLTRGRRDLTIRLVLRRVI